MLYFLKNKAIKKGLFALVPMGVIADFFPFNSCTMWISTEQHDVDTSPISPPALLYINNGGSLTIRRSTLIRLENELSFGIVNCT